MSNNESTSKNKPPINNSESNKNIQKAVGDAAIARGSNSESATDNTIRSHSPSSITSPIISSIPSPIPSIPNLPVANAEPIFLASELSAEPSSLESNDSFSDNMNATSKPIKTRNSLISVFSGSGASSKGKRVRSRTVGSPEELVNSMNTQPTLKETGKTPSQGTMEDLTRASQENIVDSFAFFCYTDVDPIHQRKILYAINHRHLLVHKNRLGSNKTLQDLANADPKNLTKRGSSLGSFGGKLNALLRSKKQKRTRTGIFHTLNLSIHDYRLTEGLNMIDLLSEATIHKKRTADINDCFLHAMSRKMQVICLQIMEKGFPVNVNSPVYTPKDTSQLTLPSYFQLAVSLDLVEVVKVMLKNRADVDASWYQVTPLMMATMRGNKNMIKILIEAGASMNQRLLLEDFLLLNRLKTSKSILRKVGTFDKDTTCWGATPPSPNLCLSKNIALENSDQFKQFGQRASVHFSPEYMETKSFCLFELAALCGNLEVASFYLELTSPTLIQTCSFGLLISENAQWTHQLIQAGAPKDQKDSYGSTPLHIAARRGDLDTVIVLLSSDRTLINTPGAEGWTALHEAISMSQLSVFQYLIWKEADESIKNKSGETARNVAEKRGFDQATMSEFFDISKASIDFMEREKSLKGLEAIPYPSSLISPPVLKQKAEKSNFGRFFTGSNNPTTSTISLGKQSGRRNIFGRSKTDSAPNGGSAFGSNKVSMI